MSQNFVQDSFSINLTKICHKSKGKFWPQVQFKVFLNANRVFLNKFILRKHYIFCSLTTDSKAFMIQHLHPKRLEWGQLDKPLWFSHKCIFQRELEATFFVTFNIIICFIENSLNPSIHLEDMKILLILLFYHKNANGMSIEQMISAVLEL